MRRFVMVSPNFWVGQTGRDLRRAGPEAQLAALYLLSNPIANYTGLYRLPLVYIANDLGLTLDQARAALAAIAQTGFALYDEASEYVWVVEGARHQLGEELKPADHKVKYVNKEFAALSRSCPFIEAFFAKYATALHLKPRKDMAAAAAPVAAPAPVAAQPALEVAAVVPEPITSKAPQPKAAPKAAKATEVVVQVADVVVEDVAEAIAEYDAERGASWKSVSVADDLAAFLVERENCGLAAEGAKKVAKLVLGFAAAHGDYCAHELIARAVEAGDYNLDGFEQMAKAVVESADI